MAVPSFVCAQDTLFIQSIPDSIYRVREVNISGNEKTKDFVILREMSLRAGSYISQKSLEYDQQRIYSLGLFNQVGMRITPQPDSSAILNVDVNERWYVFPYPIFGLQDRDPSKAFYGIGLLHYNFRGRNEKVNASAVFGYDPSLRLSYRNPFVDESGSTFLEAGLGASKVRNRSVQAELGGDNFDEKHLSGYFTLGKRFGLYNTVWMTLSYEVVDIAGLQPPRTLSPDGIDRFPTLALGYTYDSRDLREYPALGFYFHQGITKYGVPGGTVNIIRYDTDVRTYIPLFSSFVLTGRAFMNLAAAGPTPGYNRVYFGYGDRIRGHFKDVLEGESIVGVSSELHYTLLPPIFFPVGFLPAGFNVWKFGIVAAAFADAGTTWFRDEPVALNKFVAGFGGGLHFLLPYSAVVRTEYAWNEVHRGEFILGIGASF